jgi:NAD(P)-dependent dehydrogenase (short-subunit alcohol dehydrogenase family)
MGRRVASSLSHAVSRSSIRAVTAANDAASKAGLHALTHHLAPGVAGDGVIINALAPAFIGDPGAV